MIEIDRMALADCFTPLELVEWIFRHNPHLRPPIPVEKIALAAGITEIKEHPPLANTPIVGALIADDAKDNGVILIQPTPSIGRKRFTIGHELGHFLLLHHDKGSIDLKGQKLHRNLSATEIAKNQKIESEADAFSTELLLPTHLITPLINSRPSIKDAIKIASQFEMSVQATINRLVNIKVWCSTIIVFLNKDATIQYSIASQNELYDALAFRKKQHCGSKIENWPSRGQSVKQVVPASKWLKENFSPESSIEEEVYKYTDSDYVIIALTLLP